MPCLKETLEEYRQEQKGKKEASEQKKKRKTDKTQIPKSKTRSRQLNRVGRLAPYLFMVPP